MTTRADRRKRAAIAQTRAHPIAWILRHVAAQVESVQAPASLWLQWLNHHASETARASKLWPKSPEQLARTLREFNEGFAALGVIVSPHRCQFEGKPSRVWRIETEAARRHCEANPPKGRKGYTGAALRFKTPQNPENAKTSAARAENDQNHADRAGAPKMGRNRVKTTVEECRRVRPEEAAHVGATTEETSVAGSSARRLWALCPQCEKRVRFLYQPPDAPHWACRECHKLTTKARQQHGTRAAFKEWLTPARYARMSAKHPALGALYEAINADWMVSVEPYNPAKISAARRAELLTFYATPHGIRHAFNERRAQWSARMEASAQATGEQIRADLWQWWKARNRSKSARANRDS